MAEYCPLSGYKEEQIDSKNITHGPAKRIRLIYYWCEHKHSPRTEKIARVTISDSSDLHCGRILSNCTIPIEKRVDHP